MYLYTLHKITEMSDHPEREFFFAEIYYKWRKCRDTMSYL